MSVARPATTAEVAASMGLRPATVQMYARNGRIPFDTTPGGHRRFDIEEVRAALDLHQGTPAAPPTRSRGARGWLADATELEAWAERMPARHELPEVVRILVAGSVRDLRAVEFRAAEGTGMRGWDGLVDAVRGNSWVPEGKSAWELGVSEDITAKANSDYAERTKDPLGVAQSETAFVFITPRRWDNRDSWVTAKRAEGKWKDVLAYDADSLEQWLDETPAAHARITAMLGRDPDGAADLERAWNDWAARTIPPIPPALATAGRAPQAEQVLAWLHDEPSAITVWGDSAEEAFAFIAACVLELPEEERTALVSRALVVRTPAAWDEVLARAGASTSLVLIPDFPCPEPAEATDAGHRVAVPAGQNAVTVGTVIRLPQLRTGPARAALAAAGVTESKAGELARVARRSLPMLRRRLAASGSMRPQWAQPANGGELVPVVLAGAWREGNDADEQVLSKLADRPYPEISSLCTRWAAEEDMPVRREGALWLCVSKPDAWDLLSRLATSRHLTRFRETATEVLGTTDPALAVEPARRWGAGAFGPSLPWSPQLRTSFAETIAMIATQGGDRELPGVGTGQELADWIVREVLEAANADRSGQLWSSLSGVLPTLAEASPGCFLDAVDTGLGSGGLSAVFDPETESTPFASPTHTGLLWALEVLAWPPEYLGLAALALARLAHADPGGRWANRPDRSLNQIFLPWHPQTAATRDERVDAVDMLRRDAPDIAWPFMTGLLPSPHSAGYFSYKPRWRDWQPDDEPPEMSAAEWSWHADAITGRLLDDAGLDGQRWADLVARLAYVPLAQHELILDRLGDLNPAALADPDRTAVTEALRAIVRDHRRFPEAPWAMPADFVDRIAGQLSRFEDDGTAPDAAWLFARYVELPGPWPKDIEAEQRAVERLREAVARTLITDGGPDALLELAEHCEAPDILGWAAGHATADLADSMIEELGSGGYARSQAARGWVAGRFAAAGWPWATPYLEAAGAWPARRAAGFLLALPPDSRVFDWAARLGDAVRELFWENVPAIFIRDNADRERAAGMLVELGHAASALVALAMIVHQGGQADPGLVTDALAEATPGPNLSGNALTMFVYHVTSLLDYLDGRPDADRHRLAMIEWRYLPFLESRQRPAKALQQELARSPEFFAEVIAMVFRPEEACQDQDVTEEERHRAILGYQLLRSWQTVPGAPGNSGTPDGRDLAQWVTDARALLTQRGILRSGDKFIGQILSQTPEDPDGTWPGLAAREIIEATRSQDVEQGIDMAIFNSRGVTWRGMDTGGQPERALADKYHAYAQRAGTQWPRTRRMLQRMAENWDRRARQEDQLAATREEFWS
jgi:excisionase family DNA binding protein